MEKKNSKRGENRGIPKYFHIFVTGRSVMYGSNSNTGELFRKY